MDSTTYIKTGRIRRYTYCRGTDHVECASFRITPHPGFSLLRLHYLRQPLPLFVAQLLGFHRPSLVIRRIPLLFLGGRRQGKLVRIVDKCRRITPRVVRLPWQRPSRLPRSISSPILLPRPCSPVVSELLQRHGETDLGRRRDPPGTCTACPRSQHSQLLTICNLRGRWCAHVSCQSIIYGLTVLYACAAN